MESESDEVKSHVMMALMIANLAKRAAVTVFCQKCHLPHVIASAATASSNSRHFSSKCEDDQVFNVYRKL